MSSKGEPHRKSEFFQIVVQDGVNVSSTLAAYISKNSVPSPETPN